MAKTPEEDKEKEVIEIIANTLLKLCRSVESLLQGPLNKKALITLLSYSTGESRHVVEKVLISLKDLEKDYLN